MSNINLTATNTTGVQDGSTGREIVFINSIDFSQAENSLISTDIGQMILVPAKFWMTTFGIRLDTAQGATCTAVFGDGAGANDWLATAVDLNGTPGAYFQSGKVLSAATPDTFLDLYHPGKYYPDVDTIDIDPAHTVDTAQITVFAKGFMLG